MQRVKTREELLTQPFLKASDIQRLLGVSYKSAKKIYTLADKLDTDQLGDYRIEARKVRFTTVCKVTGVTLATLQKQIKNTPLYSGE